jgi:hypothetical protein
VVWILALVVFFTTAHRVTTGTSFAAFATTPVSGIAWFVAGIAALVMLVMVIGALIRLGQLHSWGWFALVLILQVLWLGIVGMVAYAAAGPADDQVAYRPTVT